MLIDESLISDASWRSSNSSNLADPTWRRRGQQWQKSLEKRPGAANTSLWGLTSGCLRRRWRFMEARVDTLVPQSWHDWASTFSCVRWTCFCSMYSVRYFLSHVAHVHVLPTAERGKEGQSNLAAKHPRKHITRCWSEYTFLTKNVDLKWQSGNNVVWMFWRETLACVD